jgi:hypothetical protein
MVRNSTAGFCPVLVTVFGMALPWTAVPAAAQSAPAVDVAGGFARVADGDIAPGGFFVEGALRLSPRFSVVGQLHRATTSGEGYFSTLDWTDVFAGGGVRFTMRPRRVVQPHLQALVGLYEVSTNETITDPRRRPGPPNSYTDRYAAFVFGAGVNVMASPHIGFRAGVDVQVLPGVLPTGRVTTGVVVPLGRR